MNPDIIRKLSAKIAMTGEECREVLAKLRRQGMDFGACASEFGDTSDESPYVKAAADKYWSEGEDYKIEIDGEAVVSESDDGGAYVQAWVWVSDEEEGVEPEPEDDDEAEIVGAEAEDAIAD